MNMNRNFNFETGLDYDIVNDRNKMSIYPGEYILNKNDFNNTNTINNLAINNFGFIPSPGSYYSNIDHHSQLINNNLTNNRNINQLFPRSIKSIPLQIRSLDLNADMILKTPEHTDNNKSAKTVVDIQLNRFEPLIFDIQNSDNIIPEDSYSCWKKGGISTRNVYKNSDYMRRLNKFRRS